MDLASLTTPRLWYVQRPASSKQPQLTSPLSLRPFVHPLQALAASAPATTTLTSLSLAANLRLTDTTALHLRQLQALTSLNLTGCRRIGDQALSALFRVHDVVDEDGDVVGKVQFHALRQNC